MYDPHRGYPLVVPCLLYDDLPEAVHWLEGVLGFQEMVRATMPDGWTGHSELRRDGFVVLLGRRGEGVADTVSMTQVFVDDVAATCEAAVLAGGSILDPLSDRPWGVRQAVVTDPGGQRWVLSQHLRDTDPADWYGEVFEPVLG
jgi:PhnB protein